MVWYAFSYGASEHWHATKHTTDKGVYEKLADLVYPWYTLGILLVWELVCATVIWYTKYHTKPPHHTNRHTTPPSPPKL